MIVRSLALMSLAFGAASTAAAAEKGGKVTWKTNPEKAMAEAKKRGAGMMLYFTSEG